MLNASDFGCLEHSLKKLKPEDRESDISEDISKLQGLEYLDVSRLRLGSKNLRPKLSSLKDLRYLKYSHLYSSREDERVIRDEHPGLVIRYPTDRLFFNDGALIIYDNDGEYNYFPGLDPDDDESEIDEEFEEHEHEQDEHEPEEPEGQE